MTKWENRRSDPMLWCAAVALSFLALALYRLAIPHSIYFDEVHYVGAARKLLQLVPANREHPMLGKEIIAASIAILGDNSFAWRLPSAVFGAVGLFAFGRFVWLLSGRRLAAILSMVLLALNFMWFVQSRIAMLDMFMESLSMIGLWQFAAAMHARRPRLHLALSGIALGLAMSAKWNAIPVAMLPGLAFAGMWFFGRNRLGAMKQVTLPEAFGWLGVLPLAVYWLTFLPVFFWTPHTTTPFHFIALHEDMIRLQDSVRKHHIYQSIWVDWIFDWRPIWYLYKNVDGAQRGIIQLGNPAILYTGLAAWLWCVWQAIFRARRDAAAMAVLFFASLSLWLDSGKPVQFFYHYVLPGAFLTGCLALALEDLWQRRGWLRALAGLVVLAALGIFVYFYPIISAAPLAAGHKAYVKWMWLNSWR